MPRTVLGSSVESAIFPKGSPLVLSPKCEMAAFRTSSNMEHARGRDGVAWRGSR
jgi:hypothetical protein